MHNSTQTILITGASAGIGAALAKRFAAPQKRLILLARNEQRLQAIKTDCIEQGAEVMIYAIDITDHHAVHTLIIKLDQQHAIDLLICNAGITSCVGKHGEPENWERMEQLINTNITAVIASIQPVIEPMQQRKQGHIVIVSSLAAFRGMPITPVYCASKSAVKAYGEALQGWLSRFNITVTIVFPGFVKSALSDQFPTNKPFIISAEKAADMIYRGIQNKRSSIAFPFLLHVGMRLLSIMPAWIANPILRFMSFGAKY